MAGSEHEPDLVAELGLGDHELISLVGGGGKTTLLFGLGRQLAGRRILTTTTKMGRDRTEGFPVLLSPTDDELAASLVGGSAALVWSMADERKAVGIDDHTADRWFDLADHVIVEADGSRQRPFKAPAPYEPVIPSRTTLVVVVMGATALGRVIEDQCHRPLRVAALAGCSPYERLTASRAAAVLISDRGSLAKVPPGARRILLITQVDDERGAAVDEVIGAVSDKYETVLVHGRPTLNA